MSQSPTSNALAIVIATKDRPDDVRNLLSNIAQQSRRPDQIIVVDGSDNPISAVVEEFSDLGPQYLRVYPPGLTKQKNAGVEAVGPEINLIGFVDDDIMFEPGALAAMLAFWEEAPSKIGGASFNLTHFNYSNSWLTSLPKRLFFIDDRNFGKVLRSGFNTPIWDTPENISSRWLGGGYTVWRKEVFSEWAFDEWYVGSGLWEDVHFSYKVGIKYDFAVVADARATHLEAPLALRRQASLGKTQVVNWVHFVRSNSDLSTASCLWGCVGRSIINLSKGAIKLDPNFILRGIGNIWGLSIVLAGTLAPQRKTLNTGSSR